MNDNETAISSEDGETVKGSLSYTPYPNTITFKLSPEQDPPSLQLLPNGDIFVNGRLAENDKEVVNGMRLFLQGHFKGQ